MSSVKKVNVLLLVAMSCAGTIFSASEELDESASERFYRYRSSDSAVRHDLYTDRHDPSGALIQCNNGAILDVKTNLHSLRQREAFKRQWQRFVEKRWLQRLFRAEDLSFAVERGLDQVVQYFLLLGACPEGDKRGMITPLIEAAFRNYPEVATLLLHAGARVNAQLGERMPTYAQLSQFGQEPAKKCPYNWFDGTTALMEAVTMGSEEVTTLLLEAGADANLEDQHGHTALTIALCNEKEHVVQQLATHGAQKPTPEQLASWTKNLSPAKKANVRKIVCAVFRG